MARHATIEKLREHGIGPSAQRVAVAEHVLDTDAHPSADEVFAAVKRGFPMISRATVYNTLNLFVKKGLLRELVLAEGRVVYDPLIEPHHHLVDDESGTIKDIPWDALKVSGIEKLGALADVHEFQVVVRGRIKPRRRPHA